LTTPPKRPLTLRDVSDACGVSEMTVSRVLRKRGDVSEATRNRVLAAAKALGTGIGRGVSFQHIEISNDQHGRPELKFTGYAAELATRLGVSHCWLSLSDEQAYAMATVILEGQS